MRKHYDDRDYMVPRMQAYEESLLKDLEASQVVHVTEQYQPGSERLEKLYQSMEQAQQFAWPSGGYEVNV